MTCLHLFHLPPLPILPLLLLILPFFQSSLLHGSLRSLLTTLCFVGIVMELCDDLIDELKLPFFSAMKGKVKMQHTGMLMLTVSHLLGNNNITFLTHNLISLNPTLT